MEKIRWGILGTARITRKLIPAFQSAKNTSLVSVASRNKEKATEFAQANQIPKSYGSYEELLEDPSIDAVYIPLPNALHVEWVEKAARAKKHILCEKPLGLTKDEVTRALHAAEENHVHLLDGFMWPHHPRTHKLKELLTSKRVGDSVSARSSFSFLLDESKPDIRRTKAMGGGALYDIGCYCIYGLRFVMGEEPSSVYASATWKNEIDTSMTGILEFASGRRASFDFGFNSPYRSDLEILGTKGRIVVPRPWNPLEIATIEVWEGGELAETLTFPPTNHIVSMVEFFSEKILKDPHPITNPQTPLHNATAIDALYQSAKSELRVLLPS